MKISLTIADRISLQNNLVDKDSFENLCLRHEILNKTIITSEEVEKNNIKTTQVGEMSSLTWNETEPIEYEFNTSEIVYVKEQLKRLSDAKELTSVSLPVYKKFFSL